jgi:hypothetical protein
LQPAEAESDADSGLDLRVPETFLDANIGRKVYVRAGKQVLQWGRCFFFNPTDLVNVERKTFFRRIGAREGAFGLKGHAPFGTAANLYAFLDAGETARPDSLTGAAKFEWLWGRSEMAVVAWGGGHRDPVFGADLSTRVLDFDLSGEWAVHSSFPSRSLSWNQNIPILEEKERHWISRAAVGLGKSFNVAGVPDRLTTVAELYFNQPGSEDGRLPLPPQGVALPGGFSRVEMLGLLAQSGLYEPNSYSRYYAAFFATLNRFFRSDLTLTFNAIGNLNQRCALLSSGIAYRDLNDFGLSLLVNGFAGPEDTEYTFSRQALQVQLIAEAAF